MSVPNFIKLKSGNLAVIPPRYDAEFRTKMSYIKAQWKPLNIGGKSVNAYVFAPEDEERVRKAFTEAFPDVVAFVPQGPFTPLPAVLIEALGFVASDGKTYAVLGGQEAFDAIKSIKGAKWNRQIKLFELLHLDLPAIQAELPGYQIIPSSSLAAEELRQIEAAQQAILAAEEQIFEQIKELKEQIKEFSFNSKSDAKASMLRQAARLEYGLQYARMPIQQLVEMQIRTLLAVVREDI